MTLRLSTGVRNALDSTLGFAGAFNKCSINIYSGSQPVSGNAAATGTLLGTVTVGSAALTKETQASATITISGATSGSVNTVTVGTCNIIPDGAVAYNTDAATTAADVCSAINRNGLFTATVSGAVVTVSPRPGAGATFNGVALGTTVTTTTATSSGNFASGISAVNALHFDAPDAGVISKPAAQVWSFVGIAAGTAGWFRLVGSVADAGALISAAPWLCRVDGSVATSGGDMNLSNIAITSGAPSTIDSFTWTQPAA